MRLFRLLTVLVAMLTIAPVQIAHGEGKNSVVSTVDFYSDYLFRGINFFDGLVFQPSLTFSHTTEDYGTFSAGLWSSIAAQAGSEATPRFFEIDYILTHNIEFDSLSISTGHLMYTFPDDDDGFDNFNEYFISTTWLTTLNPTFYFGHTYRGPAFEYYELSFSEPITPTELDEKLTITPYIAFGWVTSGRPYYADDDGLAQITGGVSFDVIAGDFTISPSVQFTRGFDPNGSDVGWFGVRFSYNLL